MVYEVLHKYLDEDININDIVLLNKTYCILKENINVNEYNKLVVLIDDIHINERKLDLSDLRSMLNEYFPHIDIDFYFESMMNEFLDLFIKKVNPYINKEYFRKDKKYVYYILIENKKYYLYEIFVNDNKVNAYCLFLSYIWCLFKIFNFNKLELINYICFNDKKLSILTNNILIIDKKYSIIEDKVLNLIKLLNNDILNFITIKYI